MRWQSKFPPNLCVKGKRGAYFVLSKKSQSANKEDLQKKEKKYNRKMAKDGTIEVINEKYIK